MTFDEWFNEVKDDMVSDFGKWVVQETIYGNEVNVERLREVLFTVWQDAQRELKSG